MNRQIKILENNLINQIAAGEVIERPASIVKELVENSIDAGAKNISIEIKNGGTTYIKIEDDGYGIKKDEIKLAFLRHSTSKIKSFEDLDNILTLGFRGEALASIASISQLEMITKTEEDDIGNKIEIDGGQVVKEYQVATLNGTTFIIKNIFFNTPARRKFLKKDSVESGYISEVINRLALGHPNIVFRYINNGIEILKTPGDNNIKNTAFYIYGKEISKNLIPISATKNQFHINGLIGLPTISRGNRTYENFFINGRYIKSGIISSAIEDGYSGKLMTGKFPVFIINMTVPENSVDINVHPTKLEVRFEDENFISDFLCDVIQKTLNSQDLVPSIQPEKDIKNFSEVLETKPYNIQKQKHLEDLLIEEQQDLSIKQQKLPNSIPSGVLFVNENSDNSTTKSIVDKVYLKDNKISKATIQEKSKKKEYTESEPKKVYPELEKPIFSINEKTNNKNFFSNYKIIGQLFNTYWIVEQDKEMFMIDQHSAHERVIYEDINQRFKLENVSSQKLVVPVIINVSPLEKSTIEENFELFQKFGFDIEDFGLNSYGIKAVPFILQGDIEPVFFIEILDSLMDKNISSVYDLKVEKIISMSCKKAVKANDRLSFIEAKSLIEKMLNLENPFSCPHGRPSVIKMTKYEIEKMFKRVQN